MTNWLWEYWELIRCTGALERKGCRRLKLKQFPLEAIKGKKIRKYTSSLYLLFL